MLFYVMSPYSGTRTEMFSRHFDTSVAATRLVREGIPLLSPILHWHFAAQTHGLPKDAEYWMAYNKRLFASADAGILLMLPGWRESKGIREELEWHDQARKPIYTLDLECPHIDGYEDKAYAVLLKNLREDYPLLREVPVS